MSAPGHSGHARCTGVVVNAERAELEAQRNALITQSVDNQRRLLEIEDRILEVCPDGGGVSVWTLPVDLCMQVFTAACLTRTFAGTLPISTLARVSAGAQDDERPSGTTALCSLAMVGDTSRVVFT